MLGDVVSSVGCDYLARGNRLRNFVRECGASLVIANGENSADGNGITPTSAASLTDAGVDVITGATYSSKAVKNGVKTALDAFSAYKGGAAQ